MALISQDQGANRLKWAEAANHVVETDLEYIAANLAEEFTALEDRGLLITGGAGVLGHYLVQSALYWNRTQARKPIRITVFDNYVRGIPEWLKQLDANPHLRM